MDDEEADNNEFFISGQLFRAEVYESEQRRVVVVIPSDVGMQSRSGLVLVIGHIL